MQKTAMGKYGHHIPIKSLAEGDRPREKALSSGIRALTDSELLAILLGSGSYGESAVGLAQKIMQSVGHNMLELSRLDLVKLQEFRGIGTAKAVTIAAALEIGRRRQHATPRERMKVTTSRDAFACLSAHLLDLPHEEFWILLLDRSHHLIRKHCISQGGVAGTVADPKLIFKKALHHLASSMILAHNHPSGSLKPSQRDLALTRKIKHAGEALDILILDHLIIGHQSYFSMADEGYL